ncbi:MAG: iron ABC transporter permease [Rhizobiales bacterium]|nr:iron ABC transporter permease [Hyphomicrobiales bacterium]
MSVQRPEAASGHGQTLARSGVTPLQAVSLILSLPLFLPLAAILFLAVTADGGGWPDLIKTVLPSMLKQTFFLAGGVAALTLVVGAVMAWLVTFYSFPGRNLMKWSAILPLAVPGYITAFAYVDYFSYSGPFQTGVRKLMGWQTPAESWLPDIRSLGGAIFVLAFSLYPYVYMSARAAFMRQPMSQLDVARTLGRTPWQAFLQIVLPQARPALAVGASLVIMEVMNDIGAVQFFGVNTLTYGIYSTWLGQGDLGTAAQLAFVLLSGIAVLIGFEQVMRSRDTLSRGARAHSPIQRSRLRGARAGAAFLALFIPIALGFLVPVLLLLHYGWRRLADLPSAAFFSAMMNSFLLAVLACAGTLFLALLFGHAMRDSEQNWLSRITRFASFGYALPGTVLAIGIIIPFGFLDARINALTQALFGYMPGLVLSGSLVALAFAYVTRFLVISTGTVNAGFEKISPHLDQVARTLGRKPFTVFREIHLPLLRPSLVTAMLLVFVDALKELPATLLLRPFDFDTLATHVFTSASLGQLEEAALPALSIAAAGLIPVFILSRNLRDAASN